MGAKRGKERRNDAVGSWWKKNRRYGGRIRGEESTCGEQVIIVVVCRRV